MSNEQYFKYSSVNDIVKDYRDLRDSLAASGVEYDAYAVALETSKAINNLVWEQYETIANKLGRD